MRLLDGPFRDAMLRDQKYLLSLDPDRLLHKFRVNVGLPSSAKPLGGWEEPSCELRGHSLGHYLSALSLMYASTGDARFKHRVDHIVGRTGQMPGQCRRRDITRATCRRFPNRSLTAWSKRKRVWAPWYTLHKIMAGLLDANRQCGNAQALDVLTNLADWVKFRVDRLTPEQMQSSLKNEHGGMNEVLANLYAVTGNPELSAAAAAFNHTRCSTRWRAARTASTASTRTRRFPKSSASPASTSSPATAISDHRRVSGRGGVESFLRLRRRQRRRAFLSRRPVRAARERRDRRDLQHLQHAQADEHLLRWSRTRAKMDFYERGLYNQILASQDPDTGMFGYFIPLKPGHFKTYSTPENSFWCCVGTGMENHAKYGETIYFHTADSLYVNLFIPSELNWPEKGSFPSGRKQNFRKATRRF